MAASLVRRGLWPKRSRSAGPALKAIRETIRIDDQSPIEPRREAGLFKRCFVPLYGKDKHMIRDATAKADIAQQWTAVKAFCRGSHRQSIIAGGAFVNETPPEDFCNLPFVLAYAVLDQVLTELMDQGTFPRPSGPRPMLGQKMSASRTHLPWTDSKLVKDGKDARNRVAHEAILLGRADCCRYIEAIEQELRSWSII